MTATMPFPRFSDDIDFAGLYDRVWPDIVEFETPSLGRLERLIDLWGEGRSFGSMYDCIPLALRNEKRWIWLEKSSVTDVTKAPYLCRGVEPADALSPKNQMRFYSPPEGPTSIVCGVALVLDGQAFTDTGLVLVVIEISANGKHDAGSALRLWQCLGRPYFEFSADGKGWTIIALCQGGVPTIERDDIRISTTGGYVELFGLGGRGDLKDISRELDVLVNGALPSPPTKTIPCLLAAAAEPRTPRKVARLRKALSHISADCDYWLYRNIVWGVLGTGWPDAEEIARQWCMSAPSRFEERSFNSVVASFNPALADRPRLGTVFHHAKEGGWDG